MNTQRISPGQVAALLIVMRLVPVTIQFPVVTATPDPAHAWQSALIGTLAAIPAVYLVFRLGSKYPEKTLVEIAEDVLGRLPGKIVSLVLVWYWLHVALNTARALGEAYTAAIMPETPMLVFLLTTVALAANAARCGLEVFARMAEIIVVIVVVGLCLIILLPYDVMRVDNLRPLLPDNIGPVIETSSLILAFFAEFCVLGMLMPYVKGQSRIWKSVLFSVLLTGAITAALTASVSLVFGATSTSLALPTFSLARMISIAGFVERLEAIAMVAWTLGAAAKIALLLWAVSLGTAKVCGLRLMRHLVYAFGALVVALGVCLYQSSVEFELFFEAKHWGVYSNAIGVGIIALLLIVSWIREV